jgi:hypothetical protein
MRGRDGGKVINWGKWNRPSKPQNDVQAVLIERGILGGRSKWLKDLVDDGSEERQKHLGKEGWGSELGCAFYVIFHKDGACDVECGQNLLARLMLIRGDEGVDIDIREEWLRNGRRL